jgi:hypothetical protein
MDKLPVRTPALQLGFYKRLKEAENSYLLPALFDCVGSIRIEDIDAELSKYVSNEKLSFVAKKGIRGELVYPVPVILKSNPQLIAYYRLFQGFSQKEFYSDDFSKFKSMEANAKLTANNEKWLPELCRSLIESSWILINGLPEISEAIIKSLTLLTLGPQFRGSRNVNLGVEAIQTVFALIKSAVAENLLEESNTHMLVESAAGRKYIIEFAPDPDIVIKQLLENGKMRNRIAIEVKGGTDFSNIHNRLGEAEKSHQKAKYDGFTQCWTIINVAGVERETWKQETPTTNELFYLEKISNVQSEDYLKFEEYLISELGL